MAPRFQYQAERESRARRASKALEALLIEKGIIGSDTVDKVSSFFETEMGPFNGAQGRGPGLGRSGVQGAPARRTPAAIEELELPAGHGGRRRGAHARGREHPRRAQPDHLHAVLLLSLADAGAAALLVQGSDVPRPRRARAARGAKEFGLDLDPAVEIKVWDSSAQIRWFVVPERRPGTEGLSEEELAKLVTPEAMMGVAKVEAAPAVKGYDPTAQGF